MSEEVEVRFWFETHYEGEVHSIVEYAYAPDDFIQKVFKRGHMAFWNSEREVRVIIPAHRILRIEHGD